MTVQMDATCATDERTVIDGVYSEYQPILRLSDERIVGYEALARSTVPGVGPSEMFAAAAAAGRTHELDWACRRAAICGALDGSLAREHALFVNIEPGTVAHPSPPWARDIAAAASGRLTIVAEITERALLRAPKQLLRLADSCRDLGWGVAIDDLGAEPDSLTLLPFLRPDVIKLDLSMIADRRRPDQGRIMTAVMDHAESTGALILAEGIETERHLERAHAFGATLGQGWLFAAAGPLQPVAAPDHPVELLSRRPLPPRSPFDLVADSPRLRVGSKDALLGMSNHLESLGAAPDSRVVVLSSFQTSARFTPATRTRYELLARNSPLVAAFGIGMGPNPAPGVRGGTIPPGDALAGEWTVVVVGAHYTGALIAKDLGDDGPERERRFAFVVTHDRDTVLAAARSLLDRIDVA